MEDNQTRVMNGLFCWVDGDKCLDRVRVVDGSARQNSWKEWSVDEWNIPEGIWVDENSINTVDFSGQEVWKEEPIDCAFDYRNDSIHYGSSWESVNYHKTNASGEQGSFAECSEQFMTLPLCILEFMRNIGRPVSEEEILEEAKRKYAVLRKSDGSLYKENQIRAVKGSLCSTGIFVKAEKNGKHWVVDEAAAKQYETKLSQKQTHLSRKWHSWYNRRSCLKRGRRHDVQVASQDGRVVGQGECGGCHECVACAHEEYIDAVDRAKVNWLISISNEMRKDARWNTCFRNPFAGSPIHCNLKELEDSLGTEKLTHVMQTFHWLRDSWIYYDSKQSADTMELPSPIKANRKKPEPRVSSLGDRQLSFLTDSNSSTFGLGSNSPEI